MVAFYFILLILYLQISINTKSVSIPFKFKSFERRFLSYDTKKFLKEYIKNDLILELNIGTSFSKIDCLLNIDSSCFIFNFKDSKNKTIIKDYYFPRKSSSYKLIIKDLTNDIIKSQDLFNFNKSENYELNFILKKINMSENDNDLLNYKYLPEIGLYFPLFI